MHSVMQNSYSKCWFYMQFYNWRAQPAERREFNQVLRRELASVKVDDGEKTQQLYEQDQSKKPITRIMKYETGKKRTEKEQFIKHLPKQSITNSLQNI